MAQLDYYYVTMVYDKPTITRTEEHVFVGNSVVIAMAFTLCAPQGYALTFLDVDEIARQRATRDNLPPEPDAKCISLFTLKIDEATCHRFDARRFETSPTWRRHDGWPIGRAVSLVD